MITVTGRCPVASRLFFEIKLSQWERISRRTDVQVLFFVVFKLALIKYPISEARCFMGGTPVPDMRNIVLFPEKINNLYEKIPWEISIRKEGKNLWINHPEVDVSAMYVALPKDIDIALLPISILADDETFDKFEIHPGDELLCLGYPFSAEANKAGFPILRSGKIASFPIVPAKETKSFLFDFEVFKGNSGGPVYFVQSTARAYGGATHIGTIQFIAGLVSEEHIITEEITSLYEKQRKVYPLALAKVIHASFIKETIEMLPSID